jgi:hypothetical protein
MMKMQIKMHHDNREICNRIDRIAKECGLIGQSDGIYAEGAEGQGFIQFTSFIGQVRDQKWFLDDVDTWLWYDNGDSNDPDHYDVDDLKQYYHTKYGYGDYVRAS